MVSLVEEEYATFTRDNQWKRVFDRIQNEAALLHTSSSKHARAPENRDRNRYRDVSPYDDYRVKLEGCINNYINASRVEVPLAGRTYILTQGPLANTSGHFWLMIWQQNSRGVLMLNKVIEDGRLKCHPYFPLGAAYNGDESLTFKDVNLRVEHLKTDDQDYFVVRTLRLVNTQTEETKVVLQFHYIDWPDFGIPKNSESFLKFLYAVRQSGVIPMSRRSDEELGPPVIHCSAGIGRSGTFCLVDSALVQVERTRSLLSLDLRSMLVDMRQYRCGLIQRPEQLQFSYMAILDGAQAILSADTNGLTDSPVEDDREELISEEESELSSAGDLSEEEMSDEPNVNTNAQEEDSGPAPPVRTSSLLTDDPSPPPPPAAEPPTDSTEVSPEVTPAESADTDIPEPPRRTTSLHKSASLDEYPPPPVPPRPPSALDRQKSAPGAVTKSPSADPMADTLDEEEEEYGYENSTPKPIEMYNNPMKKKRAEMREEKNKKLRDQVETMKAKQQATEAAKSGSHYFTHWGVLVGAGITLVLAAGLVYFRPALV